MLGSWDIRWGKPRHRVELEREVRAGEVELSRAVKPRWLHHEPEACRIWYFPPSLALFSPILPYVPVPHVWNRNIYFEPMYIRSTLLILFYRNSQLKRLPEFQKKKNNSALTFWIVLELLNIIWIVRDRLKHILHYEMNVTVGARVNMFWFKWCI